VEAVSYFMPSSALEHVPEKCAHFSEKNMLQLFNPARFLIGEVIPLRRKTL
jgi:hypothetical protein